jgi:putative colanic acid biosynthesis glycosyltransferase
VFKKHRELISNGDESWVFWGRGEHEQDERMQRINTDSEVDLDWLQTHLDGRWPAPIFCTNQNVSF